MFFSAEFGKRKGGQFPPFAAPHRAREAGSVDIHFGWSRVALELHSAQNIRTSSAGVVVCRSARIALVLTPVIPARCGVARRQPNRDGKGPRHLRHSNFATNRRRTVESAGACSDLVNSFQSGVSDTPFSPAIRSAGLSSSVRFLNDNERSTSSPAKSRPVSLWQEVES